MKYQILAATLSLLSFNAWASADSLSDLSPFVGNSGTYTAAEANEKSEYCSTDPQTPKSLTVTVNPSTQSIAMTSGGQPITTISVADTSQDNDRWAALGVGDESRNFVSGTSIISESRDFVLGPWNVAPKPTLQFPNANTMIITADGVDFCSYTKNAP